MHLLPINMKVIGGKMGNYKILLSFKNAENSTHSSQEFCVFHPVSWCFMNSLLFYLIVIWGRYFFACLCVKGVVWFGLSKNFFSEHCSFIRCFKFWNYQQPYAQGWWVLSLLLLTPLLSPVHVLLGFFS